MAQMVEQRIRNAQVVGSSPTTSSMRILSCVMLTAVACGNKEAEEKGDYLTGNKWETTSGMLLELSDDSSFKWFKSKSERDDNYYSGEYTLKSGQDAIDFLEESHGLPEESQRSALVQFAIEEDGYYALVMNNKECIEGGSNTLEEENEVVYYGYYLPDYETLKLYNLENLNTYEFTKM